MSNSAKNSKCQMQKLREFFKKKISWSQMIQNCLIRREIAKKNSVADGGFRPPLLLNVTLCAHIYSKY